jgi:putative glycerol-1-phosphate prenyltransferase
VLVDPDRLPRERAASYAARCSNAGADAILVGTSLMMGDGFSDYVASIRSSSGDLPVIIFPGHTAQDTASADAILFLSLFSGRNPDLLVGEQVRSAPVIRGIGLEAISTAYLLIESGRITSVEYMSNTKPIPSNKPEIAVAHAIAAEMFGMKFIYLEAGSGAEYAVPEEIIKRVVSAVNIPVIVGGGIRNPETARDKVRAGASFVVVGNHLEQHESIDELVRFADAIHSMG